MKNKIVASFVIALLVLSVIATGLAARSGVSDDRPVGQVRAESSDKADNTAVQTFKWVCPFH